MRVLFVNQYFPPDASATAYLLGELSEDLSKHHDVRVVAGRPSYSPGATTYRPVGPTVTRTWSTSFPRESGIFGRAVNYSTFLLTSLAGALRVPRPDVVVAMTDPPFVGVIGSMVARVRRCPFVYVCHDIFPDVGVALGKADNPPTVWLLRWLNRLLRRSADRIVVIGRDMQRKLEAEGVPGEKIVFIPNWAGDTGVPARAIGHLRRSMRWDGRFVVLHAGNVGLAQNLDVVVEAAELLKGLAEIEFVVMGDGAAKTTLQRRVKERGLANVEFLPSRPKQEAEAVVAAADVHLVTLAPGLWGCVVPSKVYGIMAAGRPFVAAVEPGSEVALLIEEAECGVRVDPGDARALADAILRVRDAPDHDMGRRGREAFLSRFERRKATERYRALLEELAPRGRRATA